MNKIKKKNHDCRENYTCYLNTGNILKIKFKKYQEHEKKNMLTLILNIISGYSQNTAVLPSEKQRGKTNEMRINEEMVLC